MANPTPTQLKDELSLDPENLYGADWANGNNGGLVTAINAPKTGVTVNQNLVTARALQESVEANEYKDLTNVKRDGWNAILIASVNGVDPQAGTITGQIADIWAAGTTTRANLLTLKTRQGSRAEELWGVNVVISTDDVREARKV